jgi:hypothetical protein
MHTSTTCTTCTGAEVIDGATNGDTAAPKSAADAPESAPMETAGPDGEIAKVQLAVVVNVVNVLT